MDRYGEAERIYQETLAAQIRTLGKDHSDAMNSMEALGVLCKEAARYGEAESLFRKALEKRKQITGFAHPDTERVRTNLIDGD